MERGRGGGGGGGRGGGGGGGRGGGRGGGGGQLQEIHSDLRNHSNTQQEITAGLRSASDDKQNM